MSREKKGFNLFIFKLKRQQRVTQYFGGWLVCVCVFWMWIVWFDDNRETELNTIKKKTNSLDNELFGIVIHGLKYIFMFFYNPLTTHKQRLPMFEYCSPMLILQPFLSPSFLLFCFLLFFVAVALFVCFQIEESA